ncbi:MAG: hypothetical protein Q9226_001437 [Calogaya cf. arnoldii]
MALHEMESSKDGISSKFPYIPGPPKPCLSYKTQPTAMTKIRSALPQIEAPPSQLAALLMKGTVPLPPATTPVPVAATVAVKNGNPRGFEFGVIVELPMTISGTAAAATGAGVIVEDPSNVAVNVVKTSVRVVVFRGALDVGLGANVVDMAASATPE